VFDRSTGLLRNSEFEGLSVSTTPDLTQRTPLRLRIEPLPPDHYAKLLPAPGGKPPILSEADFKSLLVDLRSAETATQVQAASRLLGTDLSARCGELLPIVLDMLKALIGEDDNMLNQSATEAIRAIRARQGSL
jgi:hypothetical protein